MRVVALLLGLIASPACAGEFTVGFAEVDVTPEIGKKPVYLAGFGHDRKATGVHDPIMARAVVLADGPERIAMLSVDVVGLFLPTVEKIRAGLPGFKYVLVSSTHNHEGPDTLGLWGPSPVQSGVDDDYMAKLVAGGIDAVKKADAARKPASARINSISAPELVNDSRLPKVKHDDLVVLQFRDPKTDAPLGLLVQWNCHPEIMSDRNTLVTADFVYYTVKRLRESQKCPVAYFTGTVGGLMTNLNLNLKNSTGTDLKDGTFEKTELFGRLVAEKAEQALAKTTPITLTPFDVRTRGVLIPVANNLYRLGWQFGTLRREMFEWHGDPTPKQFIGTKDISKPIALRTEIGYLKLGELDVAVIPGEIYPELVLGKVQDPIDPGADFPDAPPEPAIYAQMKGKHKMLIGLGNDELGYFVPKRQWDEKPPFCYGLKKMQYGEINSVGPETAPIICGIFRDLAK